MAMDGRPLAGGPAARVAAGMAYVPEDRRREGLAMGLSIEDNLALPHLSCFRRRRALPLPSGAKLRRFALDVAGRLKVAMASPDRSPAVLSGGNQQKLLFGRWFARPIRLLLVDEPSRGVDVGAKSEIHAEIRRLAELGAGVLMATSDIEELLALSTRVVVLNAGRLAAEFSAPPFDRNAIVVAAFGGAAAGAPA
jgi:ABC-type sugar transport system ATPase subunit